jgi:hypothetical protein
MTRTEPDAIGALQLIGAIAQVVHLRMVGWSANNSAQAAEMRGLLARRPYLAQWSEPTEA